MQQLAKIAVCMALTLTSPQFLWAGTTNNTTPQTSTDPVVRYKVTVPFRVDGKLLVCIPYEYSGMLPEIDFLYLCHNNYYKRLASLNDLSNHVRIRSADEALAYVKLKTPTDAKWIIKSWSDNRSSQDIKQAEIHKGPQFRKLPEAFVTFRNNVYTVKRPLLVEEYRTPSVYYVTETVSNFGAYRQTEAKYLGSSTSFGISQFFLGRM